MHNGAPDGIIMIGGRKFRGVTQELTAAQDHYLMGHLTLAGALEYLAKKGAAPHEVAEAAVRMCTRILVSGRACQILAGCLIEEGKTWTHESAEANAAFFRELRDSDSKNAMSEGLLGLVLGFFRYATASVATSQKSLSPI